MIRVTKISGLTGVFVAYMGNLWFVESIDSNVKHPILNFLYTQHKMFKCTFNSYVAVDSR